MAEKNFDGVMAAIEQATAQATRVAGRYAMEFFRDNIRLRGGRPYNGSLARWPARVYATRRAAGKKVLQVSGRLRDAIRIISCDPHQARIGVDNPDIAPYAVLHNYGGSVAVTAKMKRYFWAQYAKNTTRRVGGDGRVRVRERGDAPFYKAMALKKVGSRINYPARTFIHDGADIERGIERELTRFFGDINLS